MNMTSRGIVRNRKTAEGKAVIHLTDNDVVVVTRTSEGLQIRMHGDKQFVLKLKASEVAELVLSLPAFSIAKAIREADCEPVDEIPEVLKQVAIGLIDRAAASTH